MAGPQTTPTIPPRPQRERSELRDRPAGPHDNGGNGKDEETVQQADEHAIPADLPHPSPAVVIVVLIAIVVLFAGLFVLGWIPHEHQIARADAQASEIAAEVPTVTVEHPTPGSPVTDLIYPCDIRPNQATAIYTRASGFLKHWYFDIQAHVHQGQLLAEIDAPDVDAQLVQAQANLRQDQANVVKADADLKLADTTLQRYLESQKTSPGSVTEEQIDQQRNMYEDAQAALGLAKAAVAAGEATVQQLTVTVGFEKVLAPFDGVITARNYDNGALLSPTDTGAGKEMFDIAQTDLLRVFVSVPQRDSTLIRVGKPVWLMVQNYPDRKFPGVVARTSDSLDPTTRTLTVELDFPNKDESLYAGMYGQAHVPVTNANAGLTVSTGALIFNADGLQVALVRDGKAHFQRINVGRDMGTRIEVVSGLTADDLVVTNPGEKIAEGIPVKAGQAPTTAPSR